MKEMTFNDFKELVSRKLELNLDSYKIDRVERRVQGFMRRKNINTYSQCLDLLNRDPTFQEAFLTHFTINTSEFFRNPTAFNFLEKNVLPTLFKRWQKVNIWSAACSVGAEPYSIAILLNEMKIPKSRYLIKATDIDHSVLAQAQRGVYRKEALARMDEQLQAKYFQVTEDQHCQLDPTIIKCVSYSHQDLLKEKFSRGWHLIVCRNFFIYLTRQGKNTLTAKFVDALKPEGILFLGSTEFIFDPQRYGLTKLAGSFYRKPA